MSTYRVVNPYTGETVKEYPTATDAEIRESIERAQNAFEPWSTRPLAERVEILQRAAQAFVDRKEELAEIIHIEMGKPMDQGVFEAEFSGEITKYYADNAEAFLADEILENREIGRAHV